MANLTVEDINQKMTDFMQIFSGNPMTTLVGRKIEQATDPELETDDWGLNLEICDIINETDDGPRDAIRAVKKKLTVVDASKDFTIVIRTLKVLETCVNNCNLRFHVLCMNKDFIQELVRLIGPKNNPPILLQERVLSLIERWADAFDTQPELQGVVKVYHELKSKGITFPPQDLDTLAPIQTPRRTLSRSPNVSDSNSPTYSTCNMNQQQQPPQPDGPILLDSEGYNKISQDLNVVQSSVNVFNEILDQIHVKNDPEDWTLLQELDTSCRQMKVRIVDLIEWVANENLTIELLRLNDELNNVFIKYERMLKKQQSSSSKDISVPNERTSNLSNQSTPSSGLTQVASASTSTANNSIPRQPTELSLIDFKDEDDPNNVAAAGDKIEKSEHTADKQQIVKGTSTSKTSSTSPTAGGTNDPDFDIFARSRTSVYTDRKEPTNYDPVEVTGTNLQKMSLNKNVDLPAASSSSTRLPEEISSVREQDFEEIEKWLATDSNNQPTSSDPISIPNSEFENFLATRALAGDKQQTK